eukprot:scaffold4676_cov94-Isochrysis_galbana.AAC.7
MSSRYCRFAAAAAAYRVPAPRRSVSKGKKLSCGWMGSGRARNGASRGTARYGLYRDWSLRNQGPAMLVHWMSTRPVLPPVCTVAAAVPWPLARSCGEARDGAAVGARWMRKSDRRRTTERFGWAEKKV